MLSKKMLPKKYWVTRGEAHDIMGDNIINIGHAESQMGQCFADKRAKRWYELIPFSEELLRRTKNTHILVPDFGLSILTMRGLQPDKFQSNQYGEFTWSCNGLYLHQTEIPMWRLFYKEPLFTAEKVHWRHDLESQLQLISQYRYVPNARQLINFLFLKGPHGDCWEKYHHRSIRTASDGFTIGVCISTVIKRNDKGEEYKEAVIRIDKVHPIADVDDGIAVAYKPLPSPQP